MKNKLFLLFICFMMAVLPVKGVVAQKIKIPEDNKIVIDKYVDNEDWWFFSPNNRHFIKVVSSDNTILKARIGDEGAIIMLTPKGAGTCSITTTEEDGTSATYEVTVTEEYIKSSWSHSVTFKRCWYGTKRIEIKTKPDAVGTLKIGKDRYKVDTGSSGKVTIKLNKTYNLNQKVTLILNKDGLTYSVNRKLKPYTSVYIAEATSRKKLRIGFYNLHKGDIVKVRHRGHVYTLKVKKDYDGKNKTFTFKTKKKINKKRDKIVATINNKAKKKLYSKKHRIE